MTKIQVSTHDWDTKEIDVFLEGSTLHINIGDDENSIDLTPILPKVVNKPDYHLSSGLFDPLTKSLKLIASAENQPDKETTISLESLFGLIPTIQGAKGDKGDKGDNGNDGRNGTDGKSAYQIWLDIGNTGSEQDFINSLKGQKGDSGDSSDLDLSNLPTVSWKEGTSILVKQDGALKQLMPIRNLFQEVGVAMVAKKLIGLTGETYHIIVTVSNSGEATNEVTDLVITKPSLGTYSVENFTNSSSSGVTVEKLTDLTYKIKNLNSGGTAKIEFDVIPTSAGSFQFGASINTNAILDQQSNNNTATLTLSAKTPIDISYVPTQDCPMLSFTESVTGKPIFMAGIQEGTGNVLVRYSASNHGNIFADVDTITLNCDQPIGTIVGFREVITNKEYYLKKGDKYYSVGNTTPTKYIRWESITGSNLSDINLSEDSRSITITNARGKDTVIGVKPRGNNCNFQIIRLVVPIIATPLEGNVLTLTSGEESSVVINNKIDGSIRGLEDTLHINYVNVEFDYLVTSRISGLTKKTTDVSIKANGTYTFNSSKTVYPTRQWSSGIFDIKTEGKNLTVTVSNATSRDNVSITVDDVIFKLEV